MNVLKLVLIIACCLVFEISKAQNATVIKFNDFEKLTAKQNDTTYVINFWATWCKPCVTELPYFETVNEKYASAKVKVLLISLDFKKTILAVDSFITKRNIKSEVYLLDEINYNNWIDKVDTTWSGAIPVTLIINNKKKYHRFYEKDFTLEELEKAITEVK